MMIQAVFRPTSVYAACDTLVTTHVGQLSSEQRVISTIERMAAWMGERGDSTQAALHTLPVLASWHTNEQFKQTQPLTDLYLRASGGSWLHKCCDAHGPSARFHKPVSCSTCGL